MDLVANPTYHISGKPGVAVTINHENLDRKRIPGICREITRRTGLPACDVLIDGAKAILEAIETRTRK